MNFFQKNFLFSKCVAAIAIAVLILSSFAYLAYPKKADASVSVHCSFLDFNCIKEAGLDVAARILTATIIRGITNSIIGWIQGDGGRNVGFVGNIEQEFRQQIDMRGGEFLNQVAGINLCGDIGAFLQISLRTSSSYRQQFACTVTDIVDNVEDFFSDFTEGGWPAFIRITHEHQNNPYGAFLLAFDAKVQAEIEGAAALERNLLANNGFKGVQKATDSKCDKDGSGSIRCQTEYIIKTPGRLVSDMLSESVLSGPRFAYVADEIDEAITSIIGALIQKVIGSVTDGIFSEDLSDMPSSFDDADEDFLIITTSTILPVGEVDIPYAYQLSAQNGVWPYTWQVVNGALPPGIFLEETGMATGTPITEGIYTALVEVTDDVGDTNTRQIILKVLAGEGSDQNPTP